MSARTRITLLALAVAAAATVAVTPAICAAPPPAVLKPLAGSVTLTPKLLLQLVVSRSAEVRYSRAQIEVAGELSKAEEALYEVVLFGNGRRDGGERQRTVEERISSIATSRLNVLDELNSTAEVGIRERLPTGADLSLSYRLRERRNNIIGSGAAGDTEYDGAIVLNFKQPLLKGAGNKVVETDLRVSRLEYRIATLQYRQQLLKTGNDALALYWQLYRAHEVSAIRQRALDFAQKVQADTAARIDAGKLAASNGIESKAAVLLREVEQIRAQQGVREAESRLATVLNIAGLEQSGITLVLPTGAPNPTAFNLGTAKWRYEHALERWPALSIAQLRAEQAGLRLDFARNQSLPTLDLLITRSNTGLSNENDIARTVTEGARYQNWSIGLNVEVPLEGNQRARSQARAQEARVRQANIEIDSIRTALGNDVRSRWDQARGGQDELARMQGDIDLRNELLRIEKVRYDAGMAPLSQLLQRESELTESRQRLVESAARLGQANDALLFADGSLLDHYAITLKD
ncbi:TolC family protein [Massilia sp. TSP1-1-2]|uniref:TolC family protein n=1 Tax=unclassified Massilia TaxID=2609279 RepID=UPI003CEF9E37